MLEFLFHRIKSNLLLYLLLLVGAILATAVFSSIPMYSNSIMQRVLQQGLENEYNQTNDYPGLYDFTWDNSRSMDNSLIEQFQVSYHDYITADNNMPLILNQYLYKSNNVRIERRAGEINSMTCKIATLSSLSEHIEILDGRMPEPSFSDGVIEVMIPMNAMIELNLLMEAEYNLQKNGINVITVKVVGVFEAKEASIYYWQEDLYENMKTSMVMNEADFNAIIDSVTDVYVSYVQIRSFYDYTALKVDDISKTIIDYELMSDWKDEKSSKAFMSLHMYDGLKIFNETENRLIITLLILTIPIMIITMLYTFMISRIIVKNDENEIALLKSRGGSKWQIFFMYVIQSTLLGSIAFIVGPIFGSLICRVLGATNGFMSFVDRASVPININLEVRLYALIAFVLYMVCVLIPAFKACKTSIVQYKVKKNIVVTKSFWERIYLDIIFLGISFYGYYGYMIDQDNLGDAIVSGGRIDPLMFLISALFLLGANLFLIRMYPYLIRFIFFIGRKIWGPVLYFSLLNVSRAEQTSKFIMLFIMLALSFGIINSSQARTLNLNTEQRVYYNDGPDVIVSPYEDPKLVPDNYINMFLDMYPPDGIRDILTEKVGYFNYENLEGIDGITRVFTHDEVNLNERGNVISNVHMLAIEPDSFLDAAWIRDDFLPEHPNVYMNAMIKAPSGVFLSSQFRDDYGMTEGDVIRLSWDQSKKEADDGEFVGIIYGFIDVFPTYNPYHMVEIFKDQQVKEIIPETTPFALANLNFIEETNNIRNIDIWLSKEDGITDDEIQEQLVEKELEVKRVFYTNQDLIDAKRDAQLQGTNGVLTMSFVIIMLVTIMGYLIFWVMTMKGRALKFGIFRAMGMSFSQVNQIIIIEQILMTGVSIVFGSLVGIIGSKIFVPMLQKVGSPADQLPPFVVVILSSDILRTIGIATGMLLIGVIVLYVIVRRFKVNQVLKLGED